MTMKALEQLAHFFKGGQNANNARQPKGKEQAPNLTLIGTEQKMLALGLSWGVVVVSQAKARESVVSKARNMSATHMVSGTRWYGLGRSTDKNTLIKETAAGALVAAQCAGEGKHLFALELSSNPMFSKVWLCVLETDRGVSNLTVTQDRLLNKGEAVLPAIQAHLQAHDNLTVWSNIDLSGINGDELPSEKLKTFELTQLFSGDLNPRFLLEPSSKNSKLKTILILLTVFAFACVAMFFGYQAWLKNKADKARALELEIQQLTENPKALWSAAKRNWALNIPTPNKDQIDVALQSVLSLPITWQGWPLDKAACKQVAAKAPIPTNPGSSLPKNPQLLKDWSCQATYKRGSALSTNRELMANPVKAIESIRIEFLSFESVQISWTVPGYEGQTPIQLDQLKTRQEHQLSTVAFLQEASPTLADLIPISFVPIVIPPPRRADGSTIAAAVNEGVLYQATLTLKGPLRSVSAVLSRGLAANWSALNVQVSPFSGAITSKTSAYNAELKGEIYAQD
jgi:hypothetical protein